ncbi:MAG TPA: glycerol-3-phosphate 1-O-acyltransferase PlsY [Clostridia bacterium]|nr:glycerol-3-phosphate 1-O-acyltransferase PlsY [Clostridiaceae bacterium]HOA31945.1 glycerol-3-phosphate 1-O-acyltransferase PlsY [Clostridia bacterium]HPZ51983.1 glycerol-3-phosphate 1-O-acyltransferase PlsY [Clostridia bacterium]
MIYGIVSIILGYLLGSINSAVLISKVFYKTDIRTMGSGNAGTTNVLRSLGKKAAAFTFLGDFLKGIIASLVGLLLYKEMGLVLAGGAAVVGHNWPAYFGFKGGKGVLTSFSVLLFASPWAALIALAWFIIIVAITRYVSLGSITAALVVVIATYFTGHGFDTPTFWLTVFVAVLVIIRHHSNIKRLLTGTESKLGQKNKN